MNFEKAFEDLKEVKEIYDNLKVPFFLIGGTLLGAIRERNFIFGDNDIDIGMFAENSDKIPLIIEKAKIKGFRVEKEVPIICSKGKRKGYFLYRFYRNEEIDLELYFKIKDKRIDVVQERDNKYRVHINEIKFFEYLVPIHFKGLEFLIPNHVEELLNNWYGNWKVRRSAGVSRKPVHYWVVKDEILNKVCEND